MKGKFIIVCIDDSKDDLEFLKDVLSDSYDVFTFSSASDALIALEKLVPDLIICDIRMPDIDGFLFLKNYNDFFPDRDTPVLYLSSIDNSDTIAEAYDIGALDYLVKPVNPTVLCGKIRNILRREERLKLKAIEIDPENIDEKKLFELLKTDIFDKKVVFSDKAEPEIFISGNEFGQEVIERLKAQKKPFVVYLAQRDIKNLLTRGSDRKIEKIGKLSTIKAGRELITIQTEIRKHPYERVETIVSFKGRVLLKKETRIDRDLDLEAHIIQQHESAENEIKQKLENKKSTQTEESFSYLYDEGLNYYKEGNYEQALMAWEKAKKLKPDDKILDVNLEILRKKLSIKVQ